MDRVEAVALAMLQAGTEPTDPSHRHVFHEADQRIVLEVMREHAHARMEEAERFLVLLHERGWDVTPA